MAGRYRTEVQFPLVPVRVTGAACNGIRAKYSRTPENVHRMHGLVQSFVRREFVCLFACLVFNGTFSTSRLYHTIGVGNESRRAKGEHKYHAVKQ